MKKFFLLAVLVSIALAPSFAIDQKTSKIFQKNYVADTSHYLIHVQMLNYGIPIGEGHGQAAIYADDQDDNLGNYYALQDVEGTDKNGRLVLAIYKGPPSSTHEHRYKFHIKAAYAYDYPDGVSIKQSATYYVDQDHNDFGLPEKAYQFKWGEKRAKTSQKIIPKQALLKNWKPFGQVKK